MPLEERQSRHRRLFERVCAMTAEAYCSTFLGALAARPQHNGARRQQPGEWISAMAGE
jgi:trehalose-6-phosphate synthase